MLTIYPPLGSSADEITNTPAGNIAATNVQAAINELDSEKAALAGSASQEFSCSMLGVGATPLSYYAARLAGKLSGAISPVCVVSTVTFSSGSTGTPTSFNSNPSTEAASFTAGSLIGFRAQGFTLGAGSAATNYYAFYADAETDAASNFGAYLADSSSIGVTPNTSYKLRVRGSTTAATEYALDVTNSAAAITLQSRNDGQLATGTAAASPYNNTTASAANMFVTSGGIIQRSTSSARFKKDVEDMQQKYADAVIYKSRPVFYRSTCEADNPSHSYWGLIAEELAEIDPRFVHWGKPLHTVIKDVEKEVVRRDADGAKVKDAEGNFIYDTVIEQVEVVETNQDAELVPDGVMYERLVVPLILDAQRKQKVIDELLARVAALEAS